MSNHDCPCPFCGADQRLRGPECCDESARQDRIRQQKLRATELRRKELCELFCIRWTLVNDVVTPDVESFDAFLVKLVASLNQQSNSSRPHVPE